jgi:hypothetical protein
MKLNRWILLLSAAALLSFTTANAQNNNSQNNGRENRGNRDGRPPFDPAAMQQRIMESYKERLEITDDSEWKAIQPLVQKVLDSSRVVMGDRMRGMMGGRRPGGDNNDRGGRFGGGGPFGGTPSPEAEALQRAIEAKATASEIKAATAKFVEARKAHQADMEAAQANLRKVLTPRQEAIATLGGLL